MNEVVWTDVAPRDGLQNIADTISTEAKIRLVRGLLDAGVPRVEATSFVSAAWVPQLADAPAVLAGLEPDLGAHSRAHPQSPRSRARARAWRAQCARHHRAQPTPSTSAMSIALWTSRLTRSRTSSSWRASAGALLMSPCRWRSAARSRALSRRRVSSNSAPTSSTRGAMEVGVADTIGVATPVDVAAMCALVADAVPIEQLSLHVHDTRGLGVANVIAAYAGRRPPFRRIGRWCWRLPVRAALHRECVHRGRAAGTACARCAHGHRPRGVVSLSRRHSRPICAATSPASSIAPGSGVAPPQEAPRRRVLAESDVGAAANGRARAARRGIARSSRVRTR